MATETARRAGELNRSIADEIGVILLRRRMTALELARRIGMSQSAMSRRMVGDQAFDVNELQRIAEVLDVGVIDLLPRAERERELTHWYPPAVGEPRQATWAKHPIIAAAVPIPLSRSPGLRRTAPTGA